MSKVILDIKVTSSNANVSIKGIRSAIQGSNFPVMNSFGKALLSAILITIVVTSFGFHWIVKSSFSVQGSSIFIFKDTRTIHERHIPTIGHFLFVYFDKLLVEACRL
jgi:hypothetical protein